MDEPIRVLIADDHPVVRKGLRATIEEDDGLKVRRRSRGWGKRLWR